MRLARTVCARHGATRGVRRLVRVASQAEGLAILVTCTVGACRNLARVGSPSGRAGTFSSAPMFVSVER